MLIACDYESDFNNFSNFSRILDSISPIKQMNLLIQVYIENFLLKLKYTNFTSTKCMSKILYTLFDIVKLTNT